MHRQIAKLEMADRNYVDRGSQTLELAQRAHSLYVNQELSEKRKLLSCLLSNCSVDGVTLYPIYKEPFNLIVESIKMQRKYPLLDELCNSLVTGESEIVCRSLQEILAA